MIATICSRLAWGPVRTHIALLRGAARPDAPVLLTLFPPKPKPGEQRASSRYYRATCGEILSDHPPLVESISRDLQLLPGHSLGAIINEPLPQPADWQPHAGNGAVWGASNAHIGPCRWVFAECDRDGFAAAEQLALAEAVIGVAPTFTVATGGKSIHCYWRLEEAISTDQFKALQQLVITTYRHLEPDCSIDASLAKPAQVLRLAGGRHPRTGQLATIHTATDTTISAAVLQHRLEGILPAAPPPPRPGQLQRPLRILLPSQQSGPRSLEEITAALERIQPFACGQGQRKEFCRFAAGLRAAVHEAGGDDQLALELCLQHSPQVIDAGHYWRTRWSRIHATSFWWVARQSGWRPTRGTSEVAA